MLSFELSAIDLILAIAVAVLLLLYMTKLSPTFPEKASFLRPEKKNRKTETIKIKTPNGYAECPRGFGNIKRISEDNAISDRCLGCYKIMDCYDQNDKTND